MTEDQKNWILKFPSKRVSIVYANNLLNWCYANMLSKKTSKSRWGKKLITHLSIINRWNPIPKVTWLKKFKNEIKDVLSLENKDIDKIILLRKKQSKRKNPLSLLV